jgi:hypothetical protein
MCSKSGNSKHHPADSNRDEEEEYIDYSCSTAVERLARDVESLLRSWHVHDGCDRHFSVNTNPHGLTLLRGERFTWIANSVASSSSSSGQQQQQQPSTIRMELELALWDGPASKKAPSVNNNKKKKKKKQTTTLQTTPTTTTISPTNSNDDSNNTNDTTKSSPKKQARRGSKGGFFKSLLVKSNSNRSIRSSTNKNKKGESRSSRSSTTKSSSRNRRSSSVSKLEECLTKTLEDLTETTCSLEQSFDFDDDDDDDTMDGSSNHTICTDLDLYDDDDDDDDDEAKKTKKRNAKERHSHLPKSLQRSLHPADLVDMPNSLFDNFSTLFGIGQHITLTPTNPNMDLLGLVLELDHNNNNNNNGNNGNKLFELCRSLLVRHETTQGRLVLTQLLASWLQTALNTACMNCQCCLPVFGLWGHYPHAAAASEEGDASLVGKTLAKATIPIFPSWMDAARVLQGPMADAATVMEKQMRRSNSSSSLSTFASSRKRGNNKRQSAGASQKQDQVAPDEPWLKNMNYAPPSVTGSVIPTTNDTFANFTCSVLPRALPSQSIDRLSTWGDLLLQHCGPHETSVVLSGAKHVYAWWKTSEPKQQQQTETWRGLDPKEYWKQQQQQQQQQQSNEFSRPWGSTSSLSPLPSATLKDEIEDYQYACRAQALLVLEQAMGTECWGPREDPIYAMHATVVWKSENVPLDYYEDNNSTCGSIKSAAAIQALMSFPSPRTYDTSSSLLDPLQAESVRLRAFLDHGALEATLATTQRCVLACLLRSSTLAPLTLLRHLLWEDDIVDDWDHEAGNRAALQVASRARLGETTQTLVDVMDWRTCAEEMIGEEQAEKIVQEVLEGTASYGFPSPPDDIFTFDQCHGIPNNSSSNNPLLAPLFKSAPIGRLVSDLCTRMAQLRTPCSMALVWSTFCNVLRNRWDAREPLPNMSFVPGLDPSPAVLLERRKVHNIGVKADLAACLHCSEPDPDDQHCLIGQKLQVRMFRCVRAVS